MPHYYPYPSELRSELAGLRDGQDYFLWQQNHELQKLVTGVKKPVIEIGGPTETGFFWLENISFNSEPVITNISHNPLPYSARAATFAKQVADHFDATAMPYGDESIGVFLMAGMSIASDWWTGLNDEDREKAEPKFTKEFDAATLEMGQVAAGIVTPDSVTYAQRIPIFREFRRTLTPGGLVFTDGGIEEIVILQRLGFELLACLQQAVDDGGVRRIYYEFVIRKAA